MRLMPIVVREDINIFPTHIVKYKPSFLIQFSPVLSIFTFITTLSLCVIVIIKYKSILKKL